MSTVAHCGECGSALELDEIRYIARGISYCHGCVAEELE